MLRKRLLVRSIILGAAIVLIASCVNPAGGPSDPDAVDDDGDTSGTNDQIEMGSASIDATGDAALSLTGETLWSNAANVDSNNDRWFVSTIAPSGARLDITIVRGRDPGDPFAAVPDDFTFELSNSGGSVSTLGEQAMGLLLETADGTQYTSTASGMTGTAVLTKDASLNEWTITIDGNGLEEVGAAGTPRVIDLDGTLTAVPEDGLLVAEVDEVAVEGMLVTDTNLVDGALDLTLGVPAFDLELSAGYDASAPFDYQTGTYQLSDAFLEALFVRVDPGGADVILSGTALLQISAASSDQGRISGALLLYGFDSNDDIGTDTPDDTFSLDVTFAGIRIE